MDFNPLIQRPHYRESVENRSGTPLLQWRFSLILSSKIRCNYGAIEID